MELEGKILIAMPGMGDPRFMRSVVLICAHGEESAMGLIVNKPAPELAFSGILDHLGLKLSPGAREILVHFGGPVERGRGFVLHSADWISGPVPGQDAVAPSGEGSSMMRVPGGYRVSVTLDVLEAIAAGGGPQNALFALGYAGWGAGQLEAEIQRNDWLIADAPPELIFAAADKDKWGLALKGIGVDPILLSSTAGRA